MPAIAAGTTSCTAGFNLALQQHRLAQQSITPSNQEHINDCCCQAFQPTAVSAQHACRLLVGLCLGCWSASSAGALGTTAAWPRCLPRTKATPMTTTTHMLSARRTRGCSATVSSSSSIETMLVRHAGTCDTAASHHPLHTDQRRLHACVHHVSHPSSFLCLQDSYCLRHPRYSAQMTCCGTSKLPVHCCASAWGQVHSSDQSILLHLYCISSFLQSRWQGATLHRRSPQRQASCTTHGSTSHWCCVA